MVNKASSQLLSSTHNTTPFPVHQPLISHGGVCHAALCYWCRVVAFLVGKSVSRLLCGCYTAKQSTMCGRSER